MLTIIRVQIVKNLPYSRLLQVPDEEREFLTLEELKPYQLTELGLSTHSSLDSNHNGIQQQVQRQQNQEVTNDHQTVIAGANSTDHQATTTGVCSDQYSHVYYDINADPTLNDSCVTSMYMQPNDMTQTQHHVDPATINIEMEPRSAAIDSTAGQQQLQQQSQQSQSSEHQHPPLQEQQQISSNTHSSILRQHSHTGSSRKRKCSYNDTSDIEDDTGDDARSVKTTDENKKQNHSEIEKRRRDKMNTYITELSAMVPMCHAMSRKLDKLTVLRMAVQHLKTIRGAVHSYTEGHYKPAFLSDQELKMLILQAAEGFVFVVGCDRGRILYVSESVMQVLNYNQSDLLGQSWFDILHPKDVAKVKEQLSSSDLSPRERLIDAKTMLPVKTDVPQGLSRLCPGARRSFFCRMKCKMSAQIKEETDSTSSSSHRRKNKINSDKKYSVIQCTGYLKSWAPAKIGLEEQETDADGESCNLSCLVAVGRLAPNVMATNVNLPVSNYPNLRSIQFTSRHAIDGKFLFVDQRATLVLGFLPQELLGTSMYEYYHQEDIPSIAESHKAALQSTEKVTTLVYRFRNKDNGFIRLQSEWKAFKNPWTKDVEYLIAKNSVILTDYRDPGVYRSEENAHVPGNFEFFNQPNGGEIHRIINTHVEASKIGRQIAEQVLDYQRRISDSSESSPDPDSQNANPSLNVSSGENSVSGGELGAERRLPQETINRLNETLPTYNHIRNNFVSNSDNANDGETPMTNNTFNTSGNPTATTDGNDEAAMAVIMSLLEADAGLGGPVDFTGLPWPLP